MSTYIKGDAVTNATSYELLENVDGTYNLLVTASEINFEVSAMEFAAGKHKLVVKAKADGYEDSDYSNEVIYTVADLPVVNLYNAADYPVERCYYGNSPNILASNTKVVNPNRGNTTASLGLDVQKFPVEAGKTYSIKLYNAPTEATTIGSDEDNDGTYENATTVPYFGFYGLMFWETIDGIPSLKYVHTTSNGGNQFAYWNTTKQSTYTGDIPISDTNDATQFGITSNSPNAEAVVVTNLATGTKSNELSKKCIFGLEETKFTQAAQVEINDESITHMSILFGCPRDSLYQMGTVDGVKVGVLSDEDRAAAIETMQNGLVIVEGTKLPTNYVAYNG